MDGDICKKFFDYSVEEQKEMASKLELSVTKVKEILFEVNDVCAVSISFRLFVAVARSRREDGHSSALR